MNNAETGLYVGYVPGFPGAHSQGENLDELDRNLREVIEMLMEEGQPQFESEFVGIRRLTLTPADVDPELGIEARSFDRTINDMNCIQETILFGGSIRNEWEHRGGTRPWRV